VEATRETRFCYLARNLACSVYWHINGMPQLIINYRKMARKWHANCRCRNMLHKAVIWQAKKCKQKNDRFLQDLRKKFYFNLVDMFVNF
jgi:hypothetical protein